MYDFSDKVAVVTGGGGGLGKAVCLCLARDGASVVVAGRTKEKIVKVGDEVKRNGGIAIAVKVDVSKSTAVKKMVDVAIANFGKIDILMNIAGIDMVGRVVDLTEKEWDLVMETNVKSQFLCCKYVLPHMIRQRNGKIVNMASVAGKTGSAGWSAYNASKFAIIGFTQALAIEYARFGITANSVCPGMSFASPEPWEYDWKKSAACGGTFAAIGHKSESAREFFNKCIKAFVPLGREQTPEDIANAFAFLASEQAKNITGISLNVAGGMEVH